MGASRSDRAAELGWLVDYWAPVVVCAAVFAIFFARDHVFLTRGPKAPPKVSPAAATAKTRRPVPRLVTFSPETAAHLAAALDTAWQKAALAEAVPNLAPSGFPPGMDALPMDERKQTFIRAVLPHLLRANRQILGDRRRVKKIEGSLTTPGDLGQADRSFLEELAERYRVDEEDIELLEADPRALCKVLLRRVDTVPPSLALAQAALESGWGVSRFVREANNLFGQWVFAAGKGIAPKERPKGANYALAIFNHLGHSVDAYLYNLNTFWAYEAFRNLRSEMRTATDPLDPHRLAQGLKNYSTRRDAYVKEIQQVIRDNGLTRFDGTRLAKLDVEM